MFLEDPSDVLVGIHSNRTKVLVSVSDYYILVVADFLKIQHGVGNKSGLTLRVGEQISFSLHIHSRQLWTRPLATSPLC